MANIKFSVVVTVLNEERSIEVLLFSLLSQSLKPGEIIIVDAGSTDDTVSIVNSFVKTSPIPIHVLLRPGINRSEGRNVGIESANNAHIAVIDAGCEADGEWLKELSLGFSKEYQAVAGFYVPVIQKPVQRLFSVYVSTLPRDLDVSTYLPSSRSLAFTKDLWRKVGGYPKHLNTCEDLVYAAKIKETGKMTVRPQAYVLWRQADGYKAFFSQIRGYASGDVQAGYTPHVIKITSVWWRYAIFLYFPPLFIAYILYAPVKHRREIHSVKDVLLLCTIQFTADAAIMAGSLLGLVKLLEGWWLRSKNSIG